MTTFFASLGLSPGWEFLCNLLLAGVLFCGAMGALAGILYAQERFYPQTRGLPQNLPPSRPVVIPRTRKEPHSYTRFLDT